MDKVLRILQAANLQLTSFIAGRPTREELVRIPIPRSRSTKEFRRVAILIDNPISNSSSSFLSQ